MKDVMGVIYTGEYDSYLRELTANRAIAAMPVAARYRTIDFLMSSFVNSGIKNVGVITQKNYHSLMDHLGSGKEWDLHGKRDGLHILPPFLTRENVGIYDGLLDALHSNNNYLTRSRQEFVILCNGTMVYNCCFDDLIKAHIDSGAEVTIVYTRDPSVRRDELGKYVDVDENGIVTDMEIMPTHPSLPCTMMDLTIVRRETLRSMVDRAVAHGYHHLSRDVLLRMVKENRGSVRGFEHKGVVWRLDSVQSYFQFNMDMLDPAKRHALFAPNLPVYTKVRDEMAARYGDSASVKSSLVADGCIIEGTVENSVLFRGVRIAPGAHVKNCIIMQDGVVQEGAYIENCILDKQAVIKRNGKLIGPSMYPIVIAKNVVI